MLIGRQATTREIKIDSKHYSKSIWAEKARRLRRLVLESNSWIKHKTKIVKSAFMNFKLHYSANSRGKSQNAKSNEASTLKFHSSPRFFLFFRSAPFCVIISQQVPSTRTRLHNDDAQLSRRSLYNVFDYLASRPSAIFISRIALGLFNCSCALSSCFMHTQLLLQLWVNHFLSIFCTLCFSMSDGRRASNDSRWKLENK